MITITKEPISVDTLYDSVKNKNAGAITLFIGTVRELTKDKITKKLFYEAYEPMAVKCMEQIKEELNEQYDNLRISIIHRVGELQIEDIAVGIAISSPHRDESYQANRYVIERIKEMVPIWKREYWEDGSFWVGNQQETIPHKGGKHL